MDCTANKQKCQWSKGKGKENVINHKKTDHISGYHHYCGYIGPPGSQSSYESAAWWNPVWRKLPMSKTRRRGKVMWAIIYAMAFLVTFVASAVVKIRYNPLGEQYKVEWNEQAGTIYTDLSYGKGEANKFDLYVPADRGRDAYGLVVYLHAGGFTAGDKSDDADMLKWLCSKGYVAAGINYTLRTEENTASVYSQSVEIKESIPHVVEKADKLGYTVFMKMNGHSRRFNTGKSAA